MADRSEPSGDSPASFVPTSEESVIPGTTLTVAALLEELGKGVMIEDVLERHDGLTRPLVDQALAYAAEDPGFRRNWSRVANDYKKVWNTVASDRTSAFRMVDDSGDEELATKQVGPLVQLLREGLGLTTDDRVFEIGCGVARVGRQLIEHVGHWVGVDVSENMLRIAGERLAGHPGKFTLVASPGSKLPGVAPASLDKGYCHAVFIHMDKEDFYDYLLEVRRVLKPDGLFYFDVWNICDDAGWLRFEHERSLYRSRMERPAHRNQFHAPDEVAAMVRRAGLEPLALYSNHHVQVVAGNPGGGPADAAWRARMETLHGSCWEKACWPPEEISGFRRAVEALR